MEEHVNINIVSCPNEVRTGNPVTVTVQVANNHTAGLQVWIVAVATGMTFPQAGITPSVGYQIRFLDTEDVIAIGETKTYSAAFTMPDENVSIDAYAYYYTIEGYEFDSSAQTLITAIANGGGGMTEMITAIMPLFMLVILMMMMKPMMKGVGEKT